jgi:hypothetical protein
MRSRSVIAVLVFAAALALGALGDDERFRAVTPIVFDPFDSDLQDTDSALGPDNGAGLAVIDNIDVNGQLIGRGAEK